MVKFKNIKILLNWICHEDYKQKERKDTFSFDHWLCLCQDLCMPGVWAPTCSLAQVRKMMSGAPWRWQGSSWRTVQYWWPPVEGSIRSFWSKTSRRAENYGRCFNAVLRWEPLCRSGGVESPWLFSIFFHSMIWWYDDYFFKCNFWCLISVFFF